MEEDNMFRDKVREMRQLQKEYFRKRDYFVLKRCKQVEKEVDEMLNYGQENKKERTPTLF